MSENLGTAREKYYLFFFPITGLLQRAIVKLESPTAFCITILWSWFLYICCEFYHYFYTKNSRLLCSFLLVKTRVSLCWLNFLCVALHKWDVPQSCSVSREGLCSKCVLTLLYIQIDTVEIAHTLETFCPFIQSLIQPCNMSVSVIIQHLGKLKNFLLFWSDTYNLGDHHCPLRACCMAYVFMFIIF